MNRNKRMIGKKAMMAAVLAGSLAANMSPVAAAANGKVLSDQAYYTNYKSKIISQYQVKNINVIKINMDTLGEGSYDGYTVTADGTIELMEAGKSYEVTGSNIKEGLSKYKIHVKADIQLTLNNASIVFNDGILRSCGDYLGNAVQGTCPLLIEDSCKVNLILEGKNVLRCGVYTAAVGLGDNAELTIDKASTGILEAFGRNDISGDKVYEHGGTQSIGIGKIPEIVDYTSTVVNRGSNRFYFYSSLTDEPSGILKMEGGTVYMHDIVCGVAVKEAEISGGSFGIETSTGEKGMKEVRGALNGPVIESTFYKDPDGTAFTTVKNAAGTSLKEYSLELKDKNWKNAVLVDVDAQEIKDYNFSGMWTADNGKLYLYLPDGVTGRVYVKYKDKINADRAYYGNITGTGNTEMQIMDDSQDCKAILDKSGNTLNVRISGPDTAKIAGCQWFASDTKNGTYQPIEGATKTSYQIPADLKKTQYYKTEVEVLDKTTLQYKVIGTRTAAVEIKEENKKETPAKVITPVKKKISSRFIKVSWKKKKGAKGYYLYQSANGAKYKKIKKIKGNKGSVKMTVKAGKAYRYKVKPYTKKKVYKARKAKKKEVKKTVVFTFKNIPVNKIYTLKIRSGKEGNGYKKAKYKAVKKNLKTGNGSYTYRLNGKTGYVYNAELVAQ